MSKVTTPLEIYLLNVILKNQNQASVDWAAVARATGMKSEGGARNKLSLLTKAWKEDHPDGDATRTASDGVSATPKKTPKRKARSDEEKPTTPTTPRTPKTAKTLRTPRAKKAKVEKEFANDTTETTAEEEIDDDTELANEPAQD